MKSFQEFVKDLENTSTEASPLGEKGNEIEPQNLNDEPAKSIDRPEMNDDNLVQIIKIAYKKHRHQTEKFITRLAEVDPDIKNAMRGNKVIDRGIDHLNPNKDEVMPHGADLSSGPEEDNKD